MAWTRFGQLLAARQTKLKPLLMDQRFIAGIGNMYADEILFTPGSATTARSDTLTPQEIRRLYRAMVETLQEAIKHRGSSLADEQYRDLFGEIGAFQRRTTSTTGRARPAPAAGSTIVRVKANGRSTFFCPAVPGLSHRVFEPPDPPNQGVHRVSAGPRVALVVSVFLKSLTLKGFKSFADATTLEFEPGVTVVVGPNGSGKSNVVDAVAWVLGAQGPRTVRSAKMEDVIFAGTPKRPALGRAEVSLTIDNSAGLLPIDFSEVTITRTLFRSGDSEYAINRVPCRLLDVQELLSDTGVGRQQHVIVSQGNLDAVLNCRPEERRLVIEEAAGVLKYRRRKEKAERRLESTESQPGPAAGPAPGGAPPAAAARAAGRRGPPPRRPGRRAGTPSAATWPAGSWWPSKPAWPLPSAPGPTWLDRRRRSAAPSAVSTPTSSPPRRKCPFPGSATTTPIWGRRCHEPRRCGPAPVACSPCSPSAGGRSSGTAR